jgi:hypothetical protein
MKNRTFFFTSSTKADSEVSKIQLQAQAPKLPNEAELTTRISVKTLNSYSFPFTPKIKVHTPEAAYTGRRSDSIAGVHLHIYVS